MYVYRVQAAGQRRRHRERRCRLQLGEGMERRAQGCAQRGRESALKSPPKPGQSSSKPLFATWQARSTMFASNWSHADQPPRRRRASLPTSRSSAISPALRSTFLLSVSASGYPDSGYLESRRSCCGASCEAVSSSQLTDLSPRLPVCALAQGRKRFG